MLIVVYYILMHPNELSLNNPVIDDSPVIDDRSDGRVAQWYTLASRGHRFKFQDKFY